MSAICRTGSAYRSDATEIALTEDNYLDKYIVAELLLYHTHDKENNLVTMH